LPCLLRLRLLSQVDILKNQLASQFTTQTNAKPDFPELLPGGYRSAGRDAQVKILRAELALEM